MNNANKELKQLVDECLKDGKIHYFSSITEYVIQKSNKVFTKKQVYNYIYNLKKKGELISPSHGIYMRPKPVSKNDKDILNKMEEWLDELSNLNDYCIREFKKAEVYNEDIINKINELQNTIREAKNRIYTEKTIT